MSNPHYLKYKETIIRCKNEWVKNQGEEYKINILRPMILKSVKKYYIHNRAKVLAYKKRYYNYNKEVKRLFAMYDSYDERSVHDLSSIL